MLKLLILSILLVKLNAKYVNIFETVQNITILNNTCHDVKCNQLIINNVTSLNYTISNYTRCEYMNNSGICYSEHKCLKTGSICDKCLKYCINKNCVQTCINNEGSFCSYSKRNTAINCVLNCHIGQCGTYDCNCYTGCIQEKPDELCQYTYGMCYKLILNIGFNFNNTIRIYKHIPITCPFNDLCAIKYYNYSKTEIWIDTEDLDKTPLYNDPSFVFSNSTKTNPNIATTFVALFSLLFLLL